MCPHSLSTCSKTDRIASRAVFSTAESAAIWSDTGRTTYYLAFEAALAVAQGKLGIIPQKAADEIVKHCKIENIDWDELRRQTEQIGYPVLGVVKQIVKRVNLIEPGLGEYTHWGATTQVRMHLDDPASFDRAVLTLWLAGRISRTPPQCCSSATL